MGIKMRVIMLNDFPWAVCSNPEISEEKLRELGKAEAIRRYGESPFRTVYVHTHTVKDINE